MADRDTIRLSTADLTSTKVEHFLQEEVMRRRALPDAAPQPLVIRVVYSSWFYLAMAGAIGALVAWGLLEGFLDDETPDELRSVVETLAWLMLFPLVSGFIGLFLGAAEGLVSRNFLRALLCASVGLGMGVIGAGILMIPTNLIFGIMTALAASLGPPVQEGQMPHGVGLLILIMGRAAAWALMAIAPGLGQGIALREKKVIFNGLIGGALGGLLGGLLFDPIGMAVKALFQASSGAVSRGIGFAVIGIMVGLFIGLVEQWTKTAWLLMRAGPLAGKQFVIYRNPTVIGSSPKADIYLFKDPAIEPRHALIHNRGGRFEIEDCGTPDGTYVNGNPIKKHYLQKNDQVVVGKTMLEFTLRESNT